LAPELKKRIKELDFVIKEPEIRVLDTTLNTYIIAVDTFCKGTYEEPPRSEIIKLTSSPPSKGREFPSSVRVYIPHLRGSREGQRPPPIKINYSNNVTIILITAIAPKPTITDFLHPFTAFRA